MLLRNLKEKYPNVKVSIVETKSEEVCYCQECECEIDDGDWCETCSPLLGEDEFYD